ncbi:MAG: glycosyl transferase family 2 [Chloroflexi bacterium]|nr:MAG: glycosyl transferase family 2 [Chloroflexota bacterium]PIE79549.1 MAG: glycosyl transferase family 2 [Chloroflexota bacterium]
MTNGREQLEQSLSYVTDEDNGRYALSIIIVSYNTRQLLADCLASIRAAAVPDGGLEVIVVDNASQDGSQDMVRTQYPEVRLLALAENLGFSAANNRGTAVSRGEYILFLNSDTVVEPDALSQPVAYMRQHSQVGALTVRLVYPNGQRDPDNHRGFPTPWNAICHFSGLSKLLPHTPAVNGYFQSYADFSQTHAVEVIAGSYMLMPRFLVEALNGWDETYFFYGEDIDFCYRINQAGYQIIYYPQVTVLHYKGASSGLRKESAEIARPPKETRVKVAKESVRAMQVFYRKFYSEQYPSVVTWMVLAGIRLRGWFRVMKHLLK